MLLIYRTEWLSLGTFLTFQRHFQLNGGKREQSFTYNQAGQTTRYQYNHLGQRVVKVTSLGQTIHYLYNQAGQLTFEHNLDSKESKQYVWLGQQLLALSKNSQQTIPAQEMIIDDTEVNFQGQWVDATPTQYAKYQGEGYHKFKLTKKNQSDTQAQWPFTLGQTGEYEVSVRWPAEFKKQKNATAVFYDITDESGTTRVRKGQNQQRNKWVSLGKFNFVAGQEYQVTLAKGVKKGKFIFADAVKVTPVSASSQPSSEDTEPEIYYAHNNHLNTVTHLSDKDGNVVWQAEYEAFGQAVVLSDSAQLDFNLRLPGQYYDKESKLH